MADASVIESIIREKYGELGVRVYSLIDGQRNTEQISSMTGVQESKLVEMLNFMEQEGIIKMRYPSEESSALRLQHGFSIVLPPSIASRMQRYREINWSEVAARLLSIYLASLEKARKQVAGRITGKKNRKTKKPKKKITAKKQGKAGKKKR